MKKVLISFLCTACLTLGLRSQEGPGGAASGKEQLSKAVHELDGIMRRIAEVEAQASAAVRHAREAQAAAQASENGPIEAAAVDLEQQLAALELAIAQVKDGLTAAHQVAAKLAPSEVAAALAAARVKFSEAERAQKVEDAQACFEGVARDLRRPIFSESLEAQGLLSHAEFRVAEAMRSRGYLILAKEGKDTQGERILIDASKQYQRVLECVDVADSRAGSSLHAAALHRSIGIEGSFFERYTRLMRQLPAGKRERVQQRADDHRETAEGLFEQLRRNHSEATTPDGHQFVQVVRAEMARIFQ